MSYYYVLNVYLDHYIPGIYLCTRLLNIIYTQQHCPIKENRRESPRI